MGDLEAVPLPAESFDAVISNGAFCLAPSKARAFAEAHRVLKHSGWSSMWYTECLHSDMPYRQWQRSVVLT